jgi:spore maturation protein CgeB
MLKILFAAAKFDYGKPRNGLSVEHSNFYDCLRQMSGIQADFFAIDEQMMAYGRDAMNQNLIKVVEETKPDLLFCFLLTEELKKETISHITNKTKTKTFNWFADDHWRIPIFSRYWAPQFTMVSTTDSEAIEKYKSYGITNVIKTQWAANPYIYFPQDEHKNPGNLNVTFVGNNYGKRGSYVNGLKDAGLPVLGFGQNWPGGRVDHQRMLEIFSYSKINLNFSETYFFGGKEKFKLFVKLFIGKELGHYKFIGHHFMDNLRAAQGTQKRCIKGRVFEVPACGGFLMTGYSDDDISEYYIPGKEIVVFKDLPELVEKSKYYLTHEDERNAIAKAGQLRTVKDHTYNKRFEQIFKALGLK